MFLFQINCLRYAKVVKYMSLHEPHQMQHLRGPIFSQALCIYFAVLHTLVEVKLNVSEALLLHCQLKIKKGENISLKYLQIEF